MMTMMMFVLFVESRVLWWSETCVQWWSLAVDWCHCCVWWHTAAVLDWWQGWYGCGADYRRNGSATSERGSEDATSQVSALVRYTTRCCSVVLGTSGGRQMRGLVQRLMTCNVWESKWGYYKSGASRYTLVRYTVTCSVVLGTSGGQVRGLVRRLMSCNIWERKWGCYKSYASIRRVWWLLLIAVWCVVDDRDSGCWLMQVMVYNGRKTVILVFFLHCSCVYVQYT